MTSEVSWLPVPLEGRSDIYEVSTDGRVRDITTKEFRPQYPDTRGYLMVCLRSKNYLVHRIVALAFIPNPDNKPEVDHINRDKGDNAVLNLRWATRVENAHNIPARGMSGAKGVTWHKDRRKWQARIRLPTGRKHLGLYDTIEEAAAAYDEALKEAGFGDWLCSC